MKQIIALIEKLEASLYQSGKKDTAGFFKERRSILESGTKEELEQAFHDLKSCYAIVQYSDIDFSEEKLLQNIIDSVSNYQLLNPD